MPDRATPPASHARSRLRDTAAALACALLLGIGCFATQADATPAETIIERCTHEEHPALGGFTPSEYAQALRQLPTEVREYAGECEEEIRKAELAAADGQPTATTAGAGPAAVTPPTPAEQRVLSTSARRAPAAIRLGNHATVPGVVRVNIASALNALPGPLLALVVIVMLAVVALGAAHLPQQFVERLRLRRRR